MICDCKGFKKSVVFDGNKTYTPKLQFIIGECEFCSEVKGHFIKTTSDGQDIAACSKCGRVSIWNGKKAEGVERE